MAYIAEIRPETKTTERQTKTTEIEILWKITIKTLGYKAIYKFHV